MNDFSRLNKCAHNCASQRKDCQRVKGGFAEGDYLVSERSLTAVSLLGEPKQLLSTIMLLLYHCAPYLLKFSLNQATKLGSQAFPFLICKKGNSKS